MTPEEKSRQIIDKKLKESGYIVQDTADFNPTSVQFFLLIDTAIFLHFLILRRKDSE